MQVVRTKSVDVADSYRPSKSSELSETKEWTLERLFPDCDATLWEEQVLPKLASGTRVCLRNKIPLMRKRSDIIAKTFGLVLNQSVMEWHLSAISYWSDCEQKSSGSLIHMQSQTLAY